MASDGLSAVINSVRPVLLEDATLAALQVAYGTADREADLPYVLFSVSPMSQMRRLGAESTRPFRVLVKVCAAASGDSSPLAVAEPLRARAQAQLTATVSSEAARERLNRYLNPLGWSATYPLEDGPIAPYTDTVGDLERWHFGNHYRIQLTAYP